MDNAEFERRKTAALAGIGQAHGTETGKDSIDLFVERHLEELGRLSGSLPEMKPDVRYLRVTPEEAILPDLDGMPPFRAVVLVREPVSNEWRNRVSDWLVAAGCLYALAWGHECSIWDDAVDWANIGAFDFKPIPPERSVMTTWHEHETIEEVFWFARHCARHPTIALRSDLILDIASVDREIDTMRAWSSVVTAGS